MAGESKQPYDKNNVFAKILRGEMESHKIFETEHCIAILDAFPVAPGHALLIPKQEARDVTEMTAEAAAETLKELPRLCRAVQAATGVEGINVLSNCGAVAGQAVFHTHFHVIPNGKNILRFPPAGKLENPEDIVSAIKKHLF